MSKLPCNVLKISGGQIPQMPPHWLRACFEIALYRMNIQRCFRLQHLKRLANNFDYCFAEHDDPRTENLRTNNPCIEDV